MSRRARVAAMLAATVLVSSACAPGTEGVDFTPGEVDVDVDTPELRQLKKQAGVEDCEPGTGEPVATGLPDVTLPCLGGGPDVNVASLRGPLVVNFWAQNCGPCRREMPIYQAFYEKYGDRVGVLGIDYLDVRPDWALDLVRDTGVKYPSLADPGTLLAEGGLVVPGLPAIVFIDEEGHAVEVAEESAVLAHEVKSLAELESLVEEHLGVEL